MIGSEDGNKEIPFMIYESEDGTNFFVKHDEPLKADSIAVLILYMLTEYCRDNGIDFKAMLQEVFSPVRHNPKEGAKA